MREKKRREQERAVEQANRPAESSESRYSDADRKALEEMSGEGFAKGGMVKKYAKGGMACGTKKYARGGMVSGGRPPVVQPGPNVGVRPPVVQPGPNVGVRPPVVQPGPNVGPRPPSPGKDTKEMMSPRIARNPPPDQTAPMSPRIARNPPPNQMSTPMRGFKNGGFVSKVKPSGGRGTKSCKIC
jgi:hypothetical protein